MSNVAKVITGDENDRPRPSGHVQHHVSISLSELNSQLVDELGPLADMDSSADFNFGSNVENNLLPTQERGEYREEAEEELGMTFMDHAYCTGTDLGNDNEEDFQSMPTFVANEEEIENIVLFQDVDDMDIEEDVYTTEYGDSLSASATHFEGHSSEEDNLAGSATATTENDVSNKAFTPPVKTYNIRSKRLAAKREQKELLKTDEPVVDIKKQKDNNFSKKVNKSKNTSIVDDSEKEDGDESDENDDVNEESSENSGTDLKSNHVTKPKKKPARRKLSMYSRQRRAAKKAAMKKASVKEPSEDEEEEFKDDESAEEVDESDEEADNEIVVKKVKSSSRVAKSKSNKKGTKQQKQAVNKSVQGAKAGASKNKKVVDEEEEEDDDVEDEEEIEEKVDKRYTKNQQQTRNSKQKKPTTSAAELNKSSTAKGKSGAAKGKRTAGMEPVKCKGGTAQANVTVDEEHDENNSAEDDSDGEIKDIKPVSAARSVRPVTRTMRRQQKAQQDSFKKPEVGKKMAKKKEIVGDVDEDEKRKGTSSEDDIPLNDVKRKMARGKDKTTSVDKGPIKCVSKTTSENSSDDEKSNTQDATVDMEQKQKSKNGEDKDITTRPEAKSMQAEPVTRAAKQEREPILSSMFMGPVATSIGAAASAIRSVTVDIVRQPVRKTPDSKEPKAVDVLLDTSLKSVSTMNSTETTSIKTSIVDDADGQNTDCNDKKFKDSKLSAMQTFESTTTASVAKHPIDEDNEDMESTAVVSDENDDYNELMGESDHDYRENFDKEAEKESGDEYDVEKEKGSESVDSLPKKRSKFTVAKQKTITSRKRIQVLDDDDEDDDDDEKVENVMKDMHDEDKDDKDVDVKSKAKKSKTKSLENLPVKSDKQSGERKSAELSSKKEGGGDNSDVVQRSKGDITRGADKGNDLKPSSKTVIEKHFTVKSESKIDESKMVKQQVCLQDKQKGRQEDHEKPQNKQQDKQQGCKSEKPAVKKLSNEQAEKPVKKEGTVNKDDKSKVIPPSKELTIKTESTSQRTSSGAVVNPCRGPRCSKPAHTLAVYCSNNCIRQHALESIRLLGKEQPKGSSSASSSSSERIVVLERKTGKLVTGPAAPTAATLLQWLQKHPTFEVLQPGTSEKKRIPPKEVSLTQTSTSAATIKSTSAAATIPATVKPTTMSQSFSSPAIKPIPVSQTSSTPATVKPTPVMQTSSKMAPPPRSSDQTSVVRIEPKHTSVSFSTSVTVDTPAEGQGRASNAGERSAVRSTTYSKGAPDPARIAIRNNLRETLLARANETDDVMVSGPEMKHLALEIEEQLFSYYGLVDTKYKHKYRTLITHLKDLKNHGLFRKILYGEIKPYNLVRLSSEVLGSKELSRWHEPSHSKLIGTPEFDSKSPARKPESAPTPPPTTSKSPFYEAPYDYLASSLIVDTTSQHGRHFFDIHCMVCTGKVPEPMYGSGGETELPQPARRPPLLPSPPVRPPLVSGHLGSRPSDNDSSVIEFTRDPRRKQGTVPAALLPTPTIVLKSDSYPATEPIDNTTLMISPSLPSPSPATISSSSTSVSVEGFVSMPEDVIVWRGSLYAHEVAKVQTTAHLISGHVPSLNEELSDLIVITGRLPPENMYSYLTQLRELGPKSDKEVAIVYLKAANFNEDALYSQLFAYLNSRNRCGLVGACGGCIVKDMYILPLPTNKLIPHVLLPFDGPGLADNRPDLLLGIIVKHAASKKLQSGGAASRTGTYSEPSSNISIKQSVWAQMNKMDPVASTTEPAEMDISPTADEYDDADDDDVEYDPEKCSFDLPAVSIEKSDKDKALKKEKTVAKSSHKTKPGHISSTTAVLKTSKVVKKDDDDEPYDPFEDEDMELQQDAALKNAGAESSSASSSTAKAKPETVKSAASTVAISSSSSVQASVTKAAPSGAPSFNSSLSTTTSNIASVISASQAVTSVSSTTAPDIHPALGSDLLSVDWMSSLLLTSANTVAVSTIEEQRRLLSELTEKIREQKECLERQKEELNKNQVLMQTSISSSSSTLPSTMYESPESPPPGNLSRCIEIPLEKLSDDNMSPEPLADTINEARLRLAQKNAESKPPVAISAAPLIDLAIPAPFGFDKGCEGLVFDTVFTPSIQQLLSGKSFENLKSIVANVTATTAKKSEMKQESDPGMHNTEGRREELPAPTNSFVASHDSTAVSKVLTEATPDNINTNRRADADYKLMPGSGTAVLAPPMLPTSMSSVSLENRYLLQPPPIRPQPPPFSLLTDVMHGFQMPDVSKQPPPIYTSEPGMQACFPSVPQQQFSSSSSSMHIDPAANRCPLLPDPILHSDTAKRAPLLANPVVESGLTSPQDNFSPQDIPFPAGPGRLGTKTLLPLPDSTEWPRSGGSPDLSGRSDYADRQHRGEARGGQRSSSRKGFENDRRRRRDQLDRSNKNRREGQYDGEQKNEHKDSARGSNQHSNWKEGETKIYKSSHGSRNAYTGQSSHKRSRSPSTGEKERKRRRTRSRSPRATSRTSSGGGSKRSPSTKSSTRRSSLQGGSGSRKSSNRRLSSDNSVIVVDDGNGSFVDLSNCHSPSPPIVTKIEDRKSASKTSRSLSSTDVSNSLSTSKVNISVDKKSSEKEIVKGSKFESMQETERLPATEKDIKIVNSVTLSSADSEIRKDLPQQVSEQVMAFKQALSKKSNSSADNKSTKDSSTEKKQTNDLSEKLKSSSPQFSSSSSVQVKMDLKGREDTSSSKDKDGSFRSSGRSTSREERLDKHGRHRTGSSGRRKDERRERSRSNQRRDSGGRHNQFRGPLSDRSSRHAVDPTASRRKGQGRDRVRATQEIQTPGEPALSDRPIIKNPSSGEILPLLRLSQAGDFESISNHSESYQNVHILDKPPGMPQSMRSNIMPQDAIMRTVRDVANFGRRAMSLLGEPPSGNSLLAPPMPNLAQSGEKKSLLGNFPGHIDEEVKASQQQGTNQEPNREWDQQQKFAKGTINLQVPSPGQLSILSDVRQRDLVLQHMPFEDVRIEQKWGDSLLPDNQCRPLGDRNDERNDLPANFYQTDQHVADSRKNVQRGDNPDRDLIVSEREERKRADVLKSDIVIRDYPPFGDQPKTQFNDRMQFDIPSPREQLRNESHGQIGGIPHRMQPGTYSRNEQKGDFLLQQQDRSRSRSDSTERHPGEMHHHRNFPPVMDRNRVENNPASQFGDRDSGDVYGREVVFGSHLDAARREASNTLRSDVHRSDRDSLSAGEIPPSHVPDKRCGYPDDRNFMSMPRGDLSNRQRNDIYQPDVGLPAHAVRGDRERPGTVVYRGGMDNPPHSGVNRSDRVDRKSSDPTRREFTDSSMQRVPPSSGRPSILPDPGPQHLGGLIIQPTPLSKSSNPVRLQIDYQHGVPFEMHQESSTQPIPPVGLRPTALSDYPPRHEFAIHNADSAEPPRLPMGRLKAPPRRNDIPSSNIAAPPKIRPLLGVEELRAIGIEKEPPPSSVNRDSLLGSGPRRDEDILHDEPRHIVGRPPFRLPRPDSQIDKLPFMGETNLQTSSPSGREHPDGRRQMGGPRGRGRMTNPRFAGAEHQSDAAELHHSMGNRFGDSRMDSQVRRDNQGCHRMGGPANIRMGAPTMEGVCPPPPMQGIMIRGSPSGIRGGGMVGASPRMLSGRPPFPPRPPSHGEHGGMDYCLPGRESGEKLDTESPVKAPSRGRGDPSCLGGRMGEPRHHFHGGEMNGPAQTTSFPQPPMQIDGAKGVMPPSFSTSWPRPPLLGNPQQRAGGVEKGLVVCGKLEQAQERSAKQEQLQER